MILPSTIRKLALKGATVYKVEVSAFTPKIPNAPEVPGHCQYFTTLAQCDKYANDWRAMGAFCSVCAETCTMEKHYLLT